MSTSNWDMGNGPGGGINTGGSFVAGLLTNITPNVGNTAGGTDVTINGNGYLIGMSVEFDGTLATDVVVVSPTELTCKTPPHAAGLVDVRTVLPNGNYGLIAQGFTYDPNAGGPPFRVADYGNPRAEDQELLELINRARRNPTAEGVRLGIDLSAYPPIQPVIMNEFLLAAATSHTQDMAARGFFDHLNPDGVNANGRVLDSTYALHPSYGTQRTVNRTENIGQGSGNQFNTPQRVHDAFVIDAGVVGVKHRQMILGGPGFEDRREVGPSFFANLTSPSVFKHYCTQEFARTATDKPFILGTVFQDADNDGIARGAEGQGNVSVTLADQNGFSLTTQSKDAGGFGFEVFVDGTYTLTINGQSTQVVVAGKSVKVDLVNGAIRTY
ncbi:MAG: IPT/TIG domain-containing protein [Planctomycetes bacterium]|nr:IPT/TIG domain-containing protein [Planctomycetota bacterium]